MKKKKKIKIDPTDTLLLMAFQSQVEKDAFNAGGGLFKAPAARLVDFCNNKISNDLPDASYLPGLTSTDLHQVLPKLIEAVKAAK